MSTIKLSQIIQTFLLFTSLQGIHSVDDGYLRYVKDGCILRGEAMSCVKYKAVKIAKMTIFGDNDNTNETIKANQMLSLVPLDDETMEKLGIRKGEVEKQEASDARGFLSEWTEVAKYFMKLMEDFFKVKGLRVNLPEGARTIEEEVDDNDDSPHGSDVISVANNWRKSRDVPSPKTARGKRKKLAVIVPLLSLLATVKTKLMLIPILLSVMLIKKLLLVAALLLPSVLSTLKACKHHHPMAHYSYFGSNDSTDYNADYAANSYGYSASGAYGKDWASNRAYNMAKHRATASPAYITAPGTIA